MRYLTLVYRLDGGISCYCFISLPLAKKSIAVTFGKCEMRSYPTQLEFVKDGEIVARVFPRNDTGSVTLLQ